MLRVASRRTRRRWILPILHSRVMRVLSFPVVAWLLFAAAMWGTHFSPLFDAALEDPFVHDLEHGLYLVTALLFWWPAVALDPAPWRMTHPVRALYTFLQMTQNTFLSVVLLNVPTVALSALRDAGPDVGADAARRPADRGRDHVDRGRPDLPDGDHGDHRRLDHEPRAATQPGRTARPRVELAEIRVREGRLAERQALAA